MFSLGKQLLEVIFAYKTEHNKGKNPFLSKTFWVNIIALVVWASDKYLGFQIPTSDSLMILAVVNMIIRMITKRPVGFYELEEK